MNKIERGPEAWGPAGWLFMEHVALNYPVDPTLEDQDNFRDFFYSLINVLPCDECAEHYYDNLIENPIRLQNKYQLITWIIEMHNLVNIKNKKTTFTIYDFLSKHGLNLRDLFI